MQKLSVFRASNGIQLPKNHWVIALFETFGTVRNKLLLTVFLDHPVTVADEVRVGNDLLQISKLRLGQKAKLLFRAQGLVKILKLKFRQDLQLEFGQFFSADVL